MVADTNTPAEAVAQAADTQADVIAEVSKDAAKAGESAAKPARKPAVKIGRKAKVVRAKARRKPAARSKPQPTRNKRNDEMTKFDPTNIFAGFGAFPGANAFEKLFAEASERGEQAVKRSRKAAEERAEIYRGNIDAFVEAGKIAATGAQSIGQNVVAKSPTELLQLQSDFARSAFDRFVEDSSALTESVVKLAGEAIQPISNRASANVEKLNEIAA